ncbi:MAG: hypothetical protein E6R13_02905 [Spirochaetes bacterium]|nr:MAG: hypothetical protein E6R13_02905 [Spirochaetota bacterium]
MLPKLNLFNYKPISAPEPLDAYKAAMDDAVQSYDKNLQEAGLLETALSKVRALPADKEYVDKVKDKLKGTLANLASTVQGNKRWDLASDTLNELKLAFTSDQNLQGIQESYNSYLGELELEQKLKANGKTPVNLNMVDWKNHRTISPDGQLNVYKSNVQPKADYNAEMFELAKVIPFDTIESELEAAGYEGFLKATKRKELTQKKIDENLPSLFRSYSNTDTYQQQKQLKLKELNQQGITGEEANKIANQQIAQDLRDLASLRIGREEDKTFMQDPTYMSNLRLENQLAVARAKAEAKKNGQLAYEEGVFQKQDGFSQDKKHFDRVVGIANQKVITGLGATNTIPNKSEIFVLDDKSNIDLDDYQIEGFKPKGLVTSNVSGNPDFNGAFLGDLTLTKGGKERITIRAYTKNPNTDVKNSFNTLTNVHKASQDLPEGRAKVIDDTSGILGSPIFKIEIVGRKNGSYVIKPVIVNPVTGVRNLPSQSDLDAFGLKKQMTLEELENRSLNKLEPYIEQLSKSNKNLVEESWENN